MLGHTFSNGFTESMLQAGQLKPGRSRGTKALSFGDESAYDITYPVKAGGAQIGFVHVGLSKGHFDEIISRLRITFLGFISVIVIIFFGIAHWLSGYITRPMGELIQRAEDWQNCYGYRPVLLETLVDRKRFKGTCYKAANWIHVGKTTGRGRMDRDHARQDAAVKEIYVCPLSSRFRQELAGC